jgi:shikimate kinase
MPQAYLHLSVAEFGSIFLVGMMGAGKTTVGRALARRLSYTFIDSDREIVERTGVSIPVIFDIEGEAGFRAREQSVIQELVGRSNIVLATGGGAVLDPLNRVALKNHGTTIYLRASVEDLWRRTRHDRNRPLLQTETPLATLQSLFEARDPLYCEVADIVVDTKQQSVQRLLVQLCAQLDAFCQHKF